MATKPDFDVLDMKQYRMEKLPKREKSKFEKFLVMIGAPLAILVFVYIQFFGDFGFLQNINADELSKTARGIYDSVGASKFSAMNVSMLAVFAGALILWMTEAIPNYQTSLILIIALVLTGVLPEKEAYAQLGHKVM